MTPGAVAWPLVAFVVIEVVLTVVGFVRYKKGKSAHTRSAGYGLARMSFGTLVAVAFPALLVFWTIAYWPMADVVVSIAKLVIAALICAAGLVFFVRYDPDHSLNRKKEGK